MQDYTRYQHDSGKNSTIFLRIERTLWTGLVRKIPWNEAGYKWARSNGELKWLVGGGTPDWSVWSRRGWDGKERLGSEGDGVEEVEVRGSKLQRQVNSAFFFLLSSWFIAFVCILFHLECSNGFRGRFADSNQKYISTHWRKRSSNGRI